MEIESKEKHLTKNLARKYETINISLDRIKRDTNFMYFLKSIEIIIVSNRIN